MVLLFWLHWWRLLLLCVLHHQESGSCVILTGVRFNAGSLGPRELCFRYSSYVERTTVKVTAGLPAQLKMVSEPEQVNMGFIVFKLCLSRVVYVMLKNPVFCVCSKPLQVLNDHRISTPFLIQLCDNWGNPSADQRVVVKLKSSPQTLKVSLTRTEDFLQSRTWAAELDVFILHLPQPSFLTKGSSMNLGMFFVFPQGLTGVCVWCCMLVSA